MLKDPYKQKGWTATSAIVRKNRVEVKLTIDRRYTFCCSKCGNNTGEPLEIAPGRDSHCPDRFFSRINEEEKKKIKFLGIDRSIAYKAAAVRHLPHVIVCYDAYHLVSNMNEVLDKRRRATMKHPSYTYSSFMKGKRFVLLRSRETLHSDAREELRKLSLLDRNLGIAYLLKEKFREVFRSKDENTAILNLILWSRMCLKSGVSQLQRFAKGISEKFSSTVYATGSILLG